MDEQEAIAKLNQIGSADTENDHVQADEILCDFLRASGHPAVADAFEAACERVGFWYA